MTSYNNSVVRPPINSALFNVREIAKQMLLLEDHLTDTEKYCVDCIRKHFLMMEALAEEAVAMDSRSKWTEECLSLAGKIRRWEIMFCDKVHKYTISQEIRATRKELVQLIFDPRG